jgi:hypothetical protein
MAKRKAQELEIPTRLPFGMPSMGAVGIRTEQPIRFMVPGLHRVQTGLPKTLPGSWDEGHTSSAWYFATLKESQPQCRRKLSTRVIMLSTFSLMGRMSRKKQGREKEKKGRVYGRKPVGAVGVGGSLPVIPARCTVCIWPARCLRSSAACVPHPAQSPTAGPQPSHVDPGRPHSSLTSSPRPQAAA